MSSKPPPAPPPPAAEAATAARAATLEAVGAEAEVFEMGAAGALPETAAAGLRAVAFVALKARLALGVDLAAVEGLALGVVADDLVGGGDLGKARGRLRIVLVGVGVQFLGELAVGAFDLALAGTLRYPQDLVGVAHPVNLRGNQPNASNPQCGVPRVRMQSDRACARQERFQGLRLRTSQAPLACLQASPVSQDAALPLT